MSFVSQNIIPYAECMTPLCFFSFVIDECCVLTSMAYGLHVPSGLPHAGRWVYTRWGLWVPWPTLGACCDSSVMENIISHYMWHSSLLQLSCTSTSINELVVFTVVSVNVIVPRSPSVSYTLDPLQHPPHPFCRREGPKSSLPAAPTDRGFSFFWISNIHVSQAEVSFWVSEWR